MNLKENHDYRGQHSAPESGSGAPLHDLSSVYPTDDKGIYSIHAVRMHGSGAPYDGQSIAILQSLRNKPNANVKIYRAVPKIKTNAEHINDLENHKRYILKTGKLPSGIRWSGTDRKAVSDYYEHASNEIEKLKAKPEEPVDKVGINPGDWVTISSHYAKYHGDANLGGRGNYKILSKTVKANEVYSDGDSIHEQGYWPRGHVAETVVPKQKFLKDFLAEAYTKIDYTQYGSNEGGIQTDEHGVKHYVKFPKTDEQAHVEVATAKIYNKMGIHTVNPRIEKIGGRTAVVSEWNENLKILPREELQRMAAKPEHAHDFAKMRHAAVITNNRDIIGTSYDNVGFDKAKNKMVSLDQGGSMHYRAQGGTKPFEKNIDEHESFDNPRYTTSHVFDVVKNQHPMAFRNAMGDVNITDEDIRSIMKEHGLEGHAQTVIDRKNLLKNKLLPT